jgi:hypothetical protein
MNPAANPVLRLLQSSKALVVLAVTLATFGGVYKGAIQWHEANDFLKWVLGPWLLAQGVEDAAKHFAPAPVPTTPSVAPEQKEAEAAS